MPVIRGCVITLLCSAAFAALGCSDGSPLRPLTADHPWIPATVVSQFDPTAWPRDAIDLHSATVRGDTLRLAVHYGGGCAAHDFGLLLSSSFRESQPVQAPALLAHDAHDDPCDALLSATLLADLRGLAEEWRRAYQADTGTIILILAVGDSEVPVRYVF